MTWLAHTPTAVVRACSRMLPILQAEESLLERERLISALAKPEEQRRMVGAWNREAGRAKEPIRGKQVNPVALGNVGIGYELVTPKRKDE